MSLSNDPINSICVKVVFQISLMGARRAANAMWFAGASRILAQSSIERFKKYFPHQIDSFASFHFDSKSFSLSMNRHARESQSRYYS